MKKLLLFSTLLLIAGGAFAQLTVKPTSSDADSYVYVKNQILYVKNEINLTKNPTDSVEASIYLRDNGQLIQGGIESANDGNGFLSVQQNTPVTNAWAYYYWCSPVGNPAGGVSTSVGNNKHFGLNSIYESLSGVLGTDAQMSNNVATREGFSEPRLTISKRWMYMHELPGSEAEDQYHRINDNNLVPAGFGFTMKGVKNGDINTLPPPPTAPGHDQLYEFRGRPNNGDFTITVQGPAHTGTGTSARVDARMTLSGNPYPSALDLNRVFWENGNSNPISAFYFYDEDRSAMTHLYSGKPFGYGVYVPGASDPDGKPGDSNFQSGFFTAATFFIWNAGGTATTNEGSSNQELSHRFAAIGQGIMFVGTNAIAQPVTIKNSHRRFIKEGAANHSIFHRPNNYNSPDEETTTTQNDLNGDHTLSSNPNIDTRTPQLRLYVIFDEALTRDMLLLFSDETSDGYDRGFDGLSPGGMKSDAFFPIGDDNERLPYVIQGTNYDINKKIPITFKLHKTSQVEVRAIEEVRKPYQRVYLFDKLENTYRPLHSENVNASFTLPAGIYEERFYIVFRNLEIKSDIPEEELLAKEAVKNGLNFFQNNPAKQMEVSNPHGYTLKSATVYDMAGKLVISEKNLGDNTKYTFYTGNLSDGVYLIKLTTSEDFIIDYKAIVHNK